MEKIGSILERELPKIKEQVREEKRIEEIKEQVREEKRIEEIKEQVREEEEREKRLKGIKEERTVKLSKEFPPMVRKGFTSIPNYLYDLKMSIQAKWLYSILLSYAWNKNFCFPGQKEIAEKMGIARPMISRYFKELEEAGLMKTTRRGQGKTNLYTLYATVKKYSK